MTDMLTAYARAQNGPTCCRVMRDALAATSGDGSPKGLRRRALVNEETGRSMVLILYKLGRVDTQVFWCPFCGARQEVT